MRKQTMSPEIAAALIAISNHDGQWTLDYQQSTPYADMCFYDHDDGRRISILEERDGRVEVALFPANWDEIVDPDRWAGRPEQHSS